MSKWIFLEIAISLRNYQLFGVHTCGETDFLNLLNKIIIPSFSYLNFTTNKIMLSKSGTRGCWSVSIKKKKKKALPLQAPAKIKHMNLLFHDVSNLDILVYGLRSDV